MAGEKENGRGEGEWQGRRRRGKLRVSAGEESFYRREVEDFVKAVAGLKTEAAV